MSHRVKNWLVGRSNGRGRTEALQFAKKLETKVIWVMRLAMQFFKLNLRFVETRHLCIFVWIGFQSKFQILWRIKNKSEGLLKSKMCHYHTSILYTKENPLIIIKTYTSASSHFVHMLYLVVQGKLLACLMRF